MGTPLFFPPFSNTFVKFSPRFQVKSTGPVVATPRGIGVFHHGKPPLIHSRTDRVYYAKRSQFCASSSVRAHGILLSAKHKGGAFGAGLKVYVIGRTRDGSSLKAES